MPELPEVQTVVSTLSPHLTGARIDTVDLRRQDIVSPTGANLPKLLAQRQIISLTRRGKKIVFQLDNQTGFYIHLGMSGRLSLVAPGEPLQPHTHLVIEIGQRQLRFVDPRRFGGIFWLGNDLKADDGLGPEPLTLRAPELAKRLSKTRRGIKNALLDQSLVAGLGNIYVDEALFESGIHPLSRADRLQINQIRILNRAIKRVLHRAIHHRGSTLRDYRDPNDEAGKYQKLHRVYHREGKACQKCGETIKRIIVGQRSTHFCPRCQRR